MNRLILTAKLLFPLIIVDVAVRAGWWLAAVDGVWQNPWLALAGRFHAEALAGPLPGLTAAPLWGVALYGVTAAGAVLGLVLQLRRYAAFAMAWLWMLAGALTQGGELLLHGGLTHFLRLGPLWWNLGELYIVGAGVALVAAAGIGRLRPPRTLLPLNLPDESFPDLSSFARGIDNVGVDVRLSPRFVAALRRLCSSILKYEMVRNRYGERTVPPTRQDYENFRGGCRDMLTNAVWQAKHTGQSRRVALMQLAVVKEILRVVRAEFDSQLNQLRGRMHDSRGGAGQSRAMVLYEQVYQLSRERAAIEYRARKTLFEQVRRVDTTAGDELRRSLFGERSVIAPAILFNPLLSTDEPQSSRVLMDNYVLVGKRSEDWRALSRLEHLLDTLLVANAGGDPDQPPPPAWPPARWQSGGETTEIGFALQGENYPRWGDVPENIDLLFDIETPVRSGLHEAESAAIKGQRRLQRHLLWRLRRYCHDEGLLPRMLAAYKVRELQADHPEANPLLLMQLLVGGAAGRQALRHLRRSRREVERALPAAKLLRLGRRMRRIAVREQERTVLRFVHDFFAYRRDLKYFCMMGAALEQIRVREEAEEIRLATANRCLHEFLSAEEAPPKREKVSHHAIVKADLRGSTTITRLLLEQGLNPATHFERNFFGPLNELLRSFGAEKVFMEGDAAIAVVMEYEDDPETRTIVARACGLARRILEVVASHNLALRGDGLPELQLGVGVAYEAEPPSYLFDDEQPVMISPAIGRADRLSSSSWRLREAGEAEAGLWRVREYRLAPDHPLHGEKGETSLRYNVNGVALETEGFTKLCDEIEMRRMELEGDATLPAAVYYLGAYLDRRGVTNFIAVREAPVLEYREQGEGAPAGGYYYEVLTEPALLQALEQRAQAVTGTVA